MMPDKLLDKLPYHYPLKVILSLQIYAVEFLHRGGNATGKCRSCIEKK